MRRKANTRKLIFSEARRALALSSARPGGSSRDQVPFFKEYLAHSFTTFDGKGALTAAKASQEASVAETKGRNSARRSAAAKRKVQLSEQSSS